MATSEWHALLTPVLPHICTDKETPELRAVRIELAEYALYAVATDRYTLAAERQAFPASMRIWDAPAPVHIHASEAAASLRLFGYSKDEDPNLQITIDKAPVPVEVVGHAKTIDQLAVTLQTADGTRLVLHDIRDPTRDALAGWRTKLRNALSRPAGRALEGLDLSASLLGRWAKACRGGERLTAYTGPEPGDPILITVEQHFAGLWSIPRYLDGPGKTLTESPWRRELALAALNDADEAGGTDA